MRLQNLMGITCLAVLTGCVSSDLQSEHQKVFNHIMVNGEPISTETNDYGLVQALVRYDGNLYRCVRRPIDFDFCDQL